MIKYLSLTVIILLGCGELSEDRQEPTSTRTIPGPAGEKGQQGKQGEQGEQGEPCSVEQFENGVTITCPDGSVAEIYNGQNGQNGQNGKNGVNGIDGKDGKDGTDGQDSQMIYGGYACSRYIYIIGGQHYVLHGALIPLYESQWLHISNSCKLRIKKKKIETGTP